MAQVVVDFFNAARSFAVATVDAEGNPRNRPFSFSMEYDGHLVLSTESPKPVAAELARNPHVAITSVSPSTNEWVRIQGIVQELHDQAAKEKAFVVSPGLTQYFKDANDPIMKLYVVVGEANFFAVGPQTEPVKTVELK